MLVFVFLVVVLVLVCVSVLVCFSSGFCSCRCSGTRRWCLVFLVLLGVCVRLTV